MAPRRLSRETARKPGCSALERRSRAYGTPPRAPAARPFAGLERANALGQVPGQVEGLDLALEQQPARLALRHALGRLPSRIRLARVLTTPIASIAARSSRRPRPPETRVLAAVDIAGLALAKRPLVEAQHGLIGVLEAVRARPPAPPTPPASGLGLGRGEQHAVRDLLGDAGEALVGRLLGGAQPLADLLPGGRRDALGGDRAAQDLVGLTDEAQRVVDELAR
jgi:hypothetical protein